MSKQNQGLADMLKQGVQTHMPSVGDLLRDERSGGEVTPPGLLNNKFFTDIRAELGHQLKAGAHELAAAVLGEQDGFVMYQRDGKEDPTKENDGLHGPDVKQPEQDHGREL